MARIAQYLRAYHRLYTDTGDHVAYVEWQDEDGIRGRTEGSRQQMQPMVERAKRRSGLKLEKEVW